MRSFWGLMRAYWFSDSWKEAWFLTLIIALLTAATSKATVWMAEASGELVNAIAFFHDPRNINPLQSLLISAGTLFLIVFAKDAGLVGIRHLVSATLHRKWRAWLDSRFNDALLDGNHTHFHVQHGAGGGSADIRPAPDNIDQRVQESIKSMTGGAIGLAMGVLGVATSLYFVGQKLLETSTAIDGLEFLGVYGSAVLAFAAVGAYVPLNTLIAVKLGKVMERLNIATQRAEGTYRAELTTLLRRSFHVAASRGEDVQKDMHRRLYSDIDGTWAKLNQINAGYQSFELIYHFVAARIVAYGPGLASYISGQISLKSYVTGAELVNGLISQCSWFIQVMPAIAALKANAKRVTDLAQAIEDVQKPEEFYRLTGHSDFNYSRQHAVFGLTVRQLELMHQGEDAKPFLEVTNLRFRRGEWTFLKGESGCGKTSLIKAINGLWPYGRGDIVLPEGVRSFYAAQEVKLPRLSLKGLVCLPDDTEDHSDARVAAALHKAGLGSFIEYLDDECREGRPWDLVLSGGQKQKLVLARILLHKPDLLFLDEATGALDPAGKIAFHQALKEECPGMTLISVMHETEAPRSPSGAPFYDSIVTFEGGRAVKRSLAETKPRTAETWAPAARTRLSPL